MENQLEKIGPAAEGAAVVNSQDENSTVTQNSLIEWALFVASSCRCGSLQIPHESRSPTINVLPSNAALHLLSYYVINKTLF